MEKLIPYSCHSFYFYGLDLLYKAKFHKYTLRVVLIVLIIGNIITSAQRMYYFPRHSPLDFAIIFIAIGVAFASWKVLKTFSRVKKLFSMTSPFLSERESDSIKKFDRGIITAEVLIFVASVSFFTGYTLLYGNKEMVAFITAINLSNETDIDPIMSMYYDIVSYVGPIQIYFVYMAFWNCSIFYIMVLFLVKTFASNCKQFVADMKHGFGHSKEDTFKETLNRLKFYNFSVTEVNDLLAVISFLMLAFKFVALVSAFSYSSVYDSQFSILFMVANCGFTLPFTSVLLQFTIDFSCDALDMMKQFRSDAIKLLESHYTPNLSGVNAPCLKLFLEIEQITPVSIGNLFEMGRNLLLSFIEAILPFTIMIVTTTTTINSIFKNDTRC